MRAIVLEKFGGPDSLVYTDMPEPEPMPGQVVIKCWGDFSTISSASTPAAPINPLRRRTTTSAAASMWRHQLA